MASLTSMVRVNFRRKRTFLPPLKTVTLHLVVGCWLLVICVLPPPTADWLIHFNVEPCLWYSHLTSSHSHRRRQPTIIHTHIPIVTFFMHISVCVWSGGACGTIHASQLLPAPSLLFLFSVFSTLSFKSFNFTSDGDAVSACPRFRCAYSSFYVYVCVMLMSVWICMCNVERDIMVSHAATVTAIQTSQTRWQVV